VVKTFSVALDSGGPVLTEEEQYYVDHGLPSDSDPTHDADEDGMSNGDEFTAGTNPNDNTSMFKATPVREAGGVRLQAPRISGKYYRVRWRASLTEGEDWTTVTDPEWALPSDGSDLDFPVTQEGFYRLEVSRTPWP
jgi:hypothetical protein